MQIREFGSCHDTPRLSLDLDGHVRGREASRWWTSLTVDYCTFEATLFIYTAYKMAYKLLEISICNQLCI